MKNRRVVITGIGPVTGIGVGKDEFMTNVFSGKMNIQRIPEEYEKHYKFKSKYYTPAPEVKLSDYNLPKMLERIVCDATKYGLVAAKLALEDAGINIKKSDKYFSLNGAGNAGVIIGMGAVNLALTADPYIAHNQIGEEKKRFSRMIIPMLMSNSVSGWISIM